MKKIIYSLNYMNVILKLIYLSDEAPVNDLVLQVNNLILMMKEVNYFLNMLEF